MKKHFLSMALALFPSPVLRAAVTDSSGPYAYPAAYSGNPVADAGDVSFDVSKTKYGALPGNNAMGSKSVLYKGSYYVLDGHKIFRLPLNATDGTKYTQLYSAAAIDYGLSNIQIAGDYIFWEERSWSGANTVRIRRMKIDGTGLTTFADMEDKYLINGYLADNKLDEAKKYITEAEKSIDNKETIKYCDNNSVNLILSSNIKRAEQENIVVESRVDITEDCHVSDMDLCIILSNAIENATNACINITDSSDRKITISCRSKIDKLFIQVTNSFIGEVKFADDMPIRTEENHGFGTRSIASTVQKYNGLCSFTTEDGVFKMRIIL